MLIIECKRPVALKHVQNCFTNRSKMKFMEEFFPVDHHKIEVSSFQELQVSELNLS